MEEEEEEEEEEDAAARSSLGADPPAPAPVHSTVAAALQMRRTLEL